jgi:hypothetical protein
VAAEQVGTVDRRLCGSELRAWLETDTHFIDFDGGIGDPNETWPPLIYRPKATLAKHPRDTDRTGAILVWRNSEARDLVGGQLAPLVLPIASRAVEIFDGFVNGSPAAREEVTKEHELVMALARRALTTCNEVEWSEAWARCLELAAGETRQSRARPRRGHRADGTTNDTAGSGVGRRINSATIPIL